MDPILQILLSWQLVIFSLSIIALMSIVTNFVEFIMTKGNISTDGSFWNKVIKPNLSEILGAILALSVKTFPYPNGLVTLGDRFLFGLAGGLLATLIFSLVKSLLGEKIAAVTQRISLIIQPPKQ